MEIRHQHHRHRSRRPSLDDPWVARPGTEVVVSLDVTDLRAAERQQEVLELRRRGRSNWNQIVAGLKHTDAVRQAT
jgi:hypothetical protein